MGGSSSQPRPWSNVTGPLSCSRALLRSQSGPMSGLPFSSVPSSPPTRFAPQLFRVLLLRRLWLALPLASFLPVWPSTRRPWPPPRSVFESGSLGESGFSLKSAAARVCREAGARVSTNLFVRDLDLPIAIVWRSLRTGFRCSAEPNWPSIPRWFRRCRQMADRTHSVLALTGQPSPKPADASSARTRNSLGHKVARGGGIVRRDGRPLV